MSFDPAKHSEKISPFNTNIEIYSATIENTVVSLISYRLCVHSKKILSLISRWPVRSIINLSEIPFSSPRVAVVALRL